MRPEEHLLTRIHAPDERDRGFLLSSVLTAPPPERRWRYWWANGWWGDQLLTPQCVAYSWLHWIEDGPVTHPYNHVVPTLDPTAMYDRAQLKDGIPGTDYEGTTVRAGAKVLQTEGLVGTYRWAWDAHTVVNALLTTGPVVVGTWWWTGMWRPDSKDMVYPTGVREGGHAYLINGVNLDRGIVRLKNSWGRDWGRNGHAYMSIEHLDLLIRDWGEACLAEEKKLV